MNASDGLLTTYLSELHLACKPCFPRKTSRMLAEKHLQIVFCSWFLATVDMSDWILLLNEKIQRPPLFLKAIFPASTQHFCLNDTRSSSKFQSSPGVTVHLWLASEHYWYLSSYWAFALLPLVAQWLCKKGKSIPHQNQKHQKDRSDKQADVTQRISPLKFSWNFSFIETEECSSWFLWSKKFRVLVSAAV